MISIYAHQYGVNFVNVNFFEKMGLQVNTEYFSTLLKYIFFVRSVER